MKKYLIGLGIIALFAACSSNDDTYSAENAEAYKHASFDNEFEKAFGTADKTHTWGFKPTEVIDISALLAASQADQEPILPDEADAAGSRAMRKTAMASTREQYADKFYLPDPPTDAEAEAVRALLESGKYAPVELGWDSYGLEFVYAGKKMSEQVSNSYYYQYLLECYDKDSTTTTPLRLYNLQLNRKTAFAYVMNSDTKNFKIIKDVYTKYSSYFISQWQREKSEVIESSYIIIENDGRYYLCFDIDADNDYSDLILRIEILRWKKASGIVAEDLGSGASDFDYNDVVFEGYVFKIVTHYKEYFGETSAEDTEFYLWMALRAAGGTLPLYVCGQEVHQLFGVGTKTMVNTGNGSVSRPPVIFTKRLTIEEYENLLTRERQVGVSDTLDLARLPITVEYEDGTTAELKYNVGGPAEKISVPFGFEWCDERQSISSKYPKFSEWVKDKSVIWYE